VLEIIAEPGRRGPVGEIWRRLRMPQTAMSKHLRERREGEVHDWLARFRRFWSAYVDALERHLDRMDQSTPAKKKTRRGRPGASRERDKGETK